MNSKRPYLEMVPEEVRELLVEGFDHGDGMKYLKGLPLTRRRRTRLIASRSWVVHLFSQEESSSRDPLKVANQHGRQDPPRIGCDEFEALGKEPSSRNVPASPLGSLHWMS